MDLIKSSDIDFVTETMPNIKRTMEIDKLFKRLHQLDSNLKEL